MYLWLDLETTGLDPAQDFILEAAWIPSHTNIDTNFDIKSAVVEVPTEAFVRLNSNDFVLNMHTDTGLIDALYEPGNPSLIEVEAQILDTIKEWEEDHKDCRDDKQWYLAGASVHFDLAFLRIHMPTLAAKLSHRVMDTSTLKAFLGQFIDLSDAIVNEGQHRAANDVEEVISYAQNYWVHLERATDIMQQVHAQVELDQIIREETGE